MLTWELFPKNFVAHCSEPKTNFFLKKHELFGCIRFLIFVSHTKEASACCQAALLRVLLPRLLLFVPHPQKLAYSLLHVAIFIFKLFCFIMKFIKRHRRNDENF